MGGLEHTYLEHHLGHSPTDNSYLCKKHLLEARRYGHDKDYVPSWKECVPNPPIKQKCFNPNCTNKSPERLIKPMFIPNDKLMETLGIKQPAEVNQPLILCVNIIMKHMLQFMALVYHAAPAEPLQRAVQPFLDTAQMQKRCHSY